MQELQAALPETQPGADHASGLPGQPQRGGASPGLAGMLPIPGLRQQESGPAPPVGGKALVLSHQRKSHAHVARDHQETLASASLQPPPCGLRHGLGPSQHNSDGRGPYAEGTALGMAWEGFFSPPSCL